MSDQPLFLKKSYAAIVGDLLQDLRDPVGGRVALTDTAEGSVVRTLVEAFARELAVAYEQLGAVYRLGYLETAEGKALDQVVSLVGLSRQEGGHAEGYLRFSRATPAPADIRIPAGTLVAGLGVPQVETLADAVLLQGRRFILVRVATVEPASEVVPAGKLERTVRPIHGIDEVTNPGDLIVSADRETDDELRTRARFSLRRGQLGTCHGIEASVRALGVRSVRVSEHQPERPGLVDVVVGDTDLDPETITALEDAIDDARPAGVRVTLRVAEAVPVVIIVKPVLTRVAVADDEARVRSELEQRIRGYLGSLQPDQTVVLAKLRATVLEHPEIREIAVDPEGRVELTVTSKRAGVLKNPAGDLCIEGGKRVAIERIDVLLAPPVLDVWVDLVVKRLASAPPADELRLAAEKILRRHMDAEYAERGQGSRELGLDDLQALLRPKGAEITGARATRSTTGQSVALSAGGKPAQLAARERMALRSVQVTDD